MKLLRSTLGVVCLAFASAAHAQFSTYATVSATPFGFSGANYNGVSFKAETGSFTVGTFYTFPSSSRFKAGIDARYLYGPGYNGGQAFNAALRVAFVPTQNRLRPYLQIGGGVVHTDLNETYCSGFSCGTFHQGITNGVANIDFGLDIRLTPSVDWRAIDYGAAAAGSNGATRAGLGWIGTGAVYHFGQ